MNSFDFIMPKPQLFRENDQRDIKNDVIHFSEFFSPDIAQSLIQWILFHGETSYYFYQLSTGKDDIWEQYLEELMQNKAMWKTLMTPFLDVLARLDFKKLWRLESWKDWAETIAVDEMLADKI